MRTTTAWGVAVISLIQASPRDAFSFSSSSPLSSAASRSPLGPLPTSSSSSADGGGAAAAAASSSGRRHPRPGWSSVGNHESTRSTKRRHWRIGGRGPPSALSASSDSGDGEPCGTSSATTASVNGGNGDEELITKLKKENQSLQDRLRLLQIQNDQLLAKEKEQQQQQGKKSEGKKSAIPYEQRLVLEDFEGEGLPSIDARGGVVDGWSRRERRYTEPWNDEEELTPQIMELEDDDELGLSPSSPDDDELCEYDDRQSKWITSVGECPVEPDVTFLDAMKSRAAWLVGLLVLQSCSGFILSRNEALLQDHPVIVYFLTMLVGAGGNAGNQASVRVIRGLALGTLNPQTQTQFLSRELRMAFALSAILSVAGFVRAVVFRTPLPETFAVTSALSMIVFSSICLGAVLPLLLQRAGVDPAHSSTTIQVVMDILGVVLTVFVSTLVLDSGWGKMLIDILVNKMGL